MTDQRSDGLRKLNTTLLSICTAGIIWIAKQTVSNGEQISAINATINSNTHAFEELKARNNDVELSVVDLKKEVYNLQYIINQKK